MVSSWLLSGWLQKPEDIPVLGSACSVFEGPFHCNCKGWKHGKRLWSSSFSSPTCEECVRRDITVLWETLLWKLALLWRSLIPAARRGPVLQVLFSIWIVNNLHTKSGSSGWCLMQNGLGIGSLTLGCCSVLWEKPQNAAVCSGFLPFHRGLSKNVCKKNALSSVASFQKCTRPFCTQERPHCLTVNTGPSLSEVWFLPLSSPLGLHWNLPSSFPCTLTQCPLPWHWLCGCLFCVSVGFAGVVMVVGKEMNKKAGNGKQIDKSRGGVKGKGKRQRMTVSFLTSPDRVISNLSFHCWRKKSEGKGIAIFFNWEEERLLKKAFNVGRKQFLVVKCNL